VERKNSVSTPPAAAKAKTTKPVQRFDKRNLECHLCHEKGHFANECPNSARPDQVNATWAVFNTGEAGEHYKQAPHEVFLDNAAEVSIMHPRFLTDIRPNEGAAIVGVSGTQKATPLIGYLDQFFDCNACSDCMANILCQADIEDKYDVTYEPGRAYTVHLPDRNLEFTRRGKFYVADMSAWIQQAKSVNATAQIGIPYTKREVERAERAMDFVRQAGYPSEKEAIHLANDGNILGLDLTGDDIRRGFEIFGRPAAAIRGKATKKKAKRRKPDSTLQEAKSNQVMYADIMHAAMMH
jgi:hypothetical protein